MFYLIASKACHFVSFFIGLFIYYNRIFLRAFEDYQKLSRIRNIEIIL